MTSQMEASASVLPSGCRLSKLDDVECRKYFAWLWGDGGPPEDADSMVWALGHFDDGVTWGCREAPAGAWRLGHQVAPNISPRVRAETLQELRLFGDQSEVLMWRTDGEIRGRMLRDSGQAAADDPLRPSTERRILRGSTFVERLDGFTHVRDAGGAEQVLPLALREEQLQEGTYPFMLLRHYYEQDPASGAARIAATRLVKLMLGEGDA